MPANSHHFGLEDDEERRRSRLRANERFDVMELSVGGLIIVEDKAKESSGDPGATENTADALREYGVEL